MYRMKFGLLAVVVALLVACGGTVAVEPTVPPATPVPPTAESTATNTPQPTVTPSPTITPSPTATPIPTPTSLPEQAELTGDWLFTGDPGCDGSINDVQQVRFAEDGTMDWFGNKEPGRWEDRGHVFLINDLPSGDNWIELKRDGAGFSTEFEFQGQPYCQKLTRIYEGQTQAYGVWGNGQVSLPDGRQVVIGGFTDQYRPTDRYPMGSVQIFDPTLMRWTLAENLHVPHGRATHTLLENGLILVAGGFGMHPGGNTLEIIELVELYNTETMSSTFAAPLSYPVESHKAVVLPDHRVMIAGGFNRVDDQRVILNRVSIYDPDKDAWTEVAPMQTPRYNYSLALLPDGRVLAAGGFNEIQGDKTLVTSLAEVYDPETDTWSEITALASPRAFAETVTLEDGRIMLIGGQNADAILLDAVIFDPEQATWSDPVELPNSQGFRPAAILLDDGSVLVIGGFSYEARALNLVSRFDPATNEWTSLAPVAIERYNHTLSLLADGRVLVTGGESENGKTLPGFELYDPATATNQLVP